MREPTDYIGQAIEVIGAQFNQETGELSLDLPYESVEEARLVIECKKVYYADIKPELFLEKGLDKIYPAHDYHRMYIGFIINCMINA